MQVGARCTNKARLQSLILTADEFSRRGAGEGTKEEVGTWTRGGNLEEILEYLSFFPSWRSFGNGWTSLQLTQCLGFLKKNYAATDKKWSARERQMKYTYEQRIIMMELNYLQKHNCIKKKTNNITSYFRLTLYSCNYSFTFPCSFLMWEM